MVSIYIGLLGMLGCREPGIPVAPRAARARLDAELRALAGSEPIQISGTLVVRQADRELERPFLLSASIGEWMELRIGLFGAPDLIASAERGGRVALWTQPPGGRSTLYYVASTHAVDALRRIPAMRSMVDEDPMKAAALLLAAAQLRQDAAGPRLSIQLADLLLEVRLSTTSSQPVEMSVRDRQNQISGRVSLSGRMSRTDGLGVPTRVIATWSDTYCADASMDIRVDQLGASSQLRPLMPQADEEVNLERAIEDGGLRQRLRRAAAYSPCAEQRLKSGAIP